MTAPATAPTINAGVPTPRNETRSPTKEAIPAQTTATTTRFTIVLLLGRVAGDVYLFAGLHQFEPITDFQLLLHRIVRQPLNVIAHALNIPVEFGIALLHLLNLPLFFQQGGDAVRSAQREICITRNREKCD